MKLDVSRREFRVDHGEILVQIPRETVALRPTSSHCVPVFHNGPGDGIVPSWDGMPMTTMEHDVAFGWMNLMRMRMRMRRMKLWAATVVSQ